MVRVPVSNTYNIHPIVSTIERGIQDVNSVLDIGAGFGKYGVLLRERLDIKRLNCYDPERWTHQIDCVEVWRDYVTPLHRYIYDTIYIGDIRDLAGGLPDYDVILMLEVLEHMPKVDGEKLLGVIFRKCNKLLVLSFPHRFSKRDGAGWDNPYEQHQCLWKGDDVAAICGKVNKLTNSAYTIWKQ